MTTETEAPQTGEVETEVTEPVEMQAAPTEAATTEEKPAEEQPPRQAWWQKRIDELTKDKKGAQEEADRYRREAEAARALLQPAKPGGTAETPPERPQATTQTPDLETLVEQRAQQKIRAEQFNASCNTAFEKGTKEFGDKFGEAIGNLRAAGVINNENIAFVEAALETEAPEKVLYELGAKPEEAMRIFAMPPTKMAIEMDRLARQLSAPAKPQVSNAPAPITPIGARSSKAIDLADPSMSMKDWVAAREKQQKERRA